MQNILHADGVEYIVCLASDMPKDGIHSVRFTRGEAMEVAVELAKRDKGGCYILMVRELVQAPVEETVYAVPSVGEPAQPVD